MLSVCKTPPSGRGSATASKLSDDSSSFPVGGHPDD